MASHCLNGRGHTSSRVAGGSSSYCTDISVSYSKTYKSTTFTRYRHRFASEQGYRIAVNTETTVNVSFTGSLTNCLNTTASFSLSLRYFNVRLPSHRHILSRVSISLPVSSLTDGTGDWFVPFVLTGTASLPPGIYQFDVLVYPIVPSATADDSSCCSSDTGSDTESVSSSSSGCSSSSSSTATACPPPTTYKLTGDGVLSIHGIKKSL